MLADRDLINKIRVLREIKPNQNWAFEVKKDIFSRITEKSLFWNFSFGLKPIAITVTILIFFSVISGTIWLTKESLPGHSFYSWKLAYQDLRTKFLSEEQKSKVYLEYAYQRIEDLDRVKETEDFDKTLKIITNDFSKATSSLKNLKMPEKTIVAAANLIEQTTKIEESLAEKKENLAESSKEKFVQMEELIKETRKEVLTTLIAVSENLNGYKEMAEKLQKEIEEEIQRQQKLDLKIE